MPLKLLDTIGRYQLLIQLGSGGMGAVYKAQDLKLKREVALKIMHPSLSHNQDFRDRFLQEAQSGARLKHPGIVQVHDVGEEGDYLFIVMDFIAGENLSTRMKALWAEKHPMPLEEALELVRQVSLALAYAHQNGVLHRDIKPANILLEPVTGEKLPYRPVLTDLGLAKLLVGGLETQTGTSMGTPAYMAPEQALGKAVDARSDVYTLGVLLYELVTGKLPFPLKTISEAIRCHMYEPPPVPPPLPPEYPADLSRLLTQTLQRNPDYRPASAADFAALLGGLLAVDEEPSEAGSSAAAVAGPTAVPTAGAREGGTAISGEADEGRGPSIWKKLKPLPEEQGIDHVEIFAPGGECHTVSLGKEALTIGRDENSNVVLDDLKASRQHARVDFDGVHYRLTDLNSTNGTFLGRTRLLPAVPETWLPDKPLRIGDHYLRLVLAKAGSEIMKANQGGTLVDMKLAVVSEGGGRIGVAAPQASLTVEAGSPAVLSFTIVNQGILVDHFTMAVEGLPSDWVMAFPAPLQLLPGKSQEVSLPIQPPRQPASRATRYPFTLRVASQSNPAEVVETRCALTILPYTQFTSQLQPQRLQSKKPGRVKVQNQGNAPETLTVTFTDRGDELVFSPPESRLKIPEGKPDETVFTARPKKIRWVGGEKIHPFTVSVAVERKPGPLGLPSATAQVHQGELLSQGLIASWLLAVLIPFCLVLALAGAVGVPLLRDADRDGLTTFEEMRSGTNPNEGDSDGDTILDGTEVKSLGTDPLRRDTDGDKLDDSTEISGCTSPLLVDTDGDGVNDGVDPEPCDAAPSPIQPTNAGPTDWPTNPPPTELTPVNVAASASVQPAAVSESCPYTMKFTGALSSDGPAALTFRWERSDGSQSAPQTVTFEQAGSLPVTDTVQGNASGEYSDRLHILEPQNFSSSPAYFRLTCPAAQASTFSARVSVTPASYSGACPAVFDFSGTITTDGPASVRYNWLKSGGSFTDESAVPFSQSGTQTVSYRWEISTSGTHGLKLHLISPVDILADEAVFTLACARTPITVENAAQVRSLSSLSGFDNPVFSLVFAPTGGFLAAATYSELRFWSIPEGSLQLQTQRSGNVTGIAFSPNGTYLAISTRDGRVDLEQVASPSKLDHLYDVFSPNGETMDGVAFAPYGEVMAAFSQAGKVLFWNLTQKKWVQTLEGSPMRGTILSLAFSKSGQYLAAGAFAGDITGLGTSNEDDVYIWQPRQSVFERTLAESGCNWVSRLVFSPVDEALLAVGNISDGDVRLWRVSDGAVLQRMHIGEVGQALAFSPDGSLLATNYGSKVALWRVSNGDQLALLSGHSGNILSLAFSPDGSVLASASEDHTVILWSVEGL